MGGHDNFEECSPQRIVQRKASEMAGVSPSGAAFTTPAPVPGPGPGEAPLAGDAPALMAGFGRGASQQHLSRGQPLAKGWVYGASPAEAVVQQADVDAAEDGSETAAGKGAVATKTRTKNKNNRAADVPQCFPDTFLFAGCGDYTVPWFEVGRCKLDPGLKAPAFKISYLMKRKLLST